MIIKMLKDERGSLNGIEVRLFKKDGVYTVNDSLGTVFVKVLRVAVEEKSVSSAPENKSVAQEEIKTQPEEKIYDDYVYKPRKNK